jgi:cob(I)alamin adenosyltransferase
MVRLSRIYTRTGDDGTTSLVGGERLRKDDARIEAYGTVDELNAVLGMVRDASQRHGPDDAHAVLDPMLAEVQQKLFDLGSRLATLQPEQFPMLPDVGAPHVAALEQQLDQLNDELEPLKSFVLPGGGPVGSVLHLARTVCRRAERRVLSLDGLATVAPEHVKYLNRLSDFLFVAARWHGKRSGIGEVLWVPGAAP